MAVATTATLSPLSFTSYFDPSTGAAKSVSMYFYRAGTLDPITVYISSDLGTPHAIPVLSTGYGRIPPIWVGEIDPLPEHNYYRVRVFDQYSTLVEDVDFIPGGQEPLHEDDTEPPSGVQPDDVHLHKTGDLVFAMANTLSPRPGCVLCNGTTIGPPGSPANRANADTYNLFIWLWGQDLLNGAFAVVPSRGSTAQGDWDAGNKAITLPNFQGATLVGLDGMGGGLATDFLKDVPYSYGNNKMLGARGGEAWHVLSEAELAAHLHVMDAHNHTGTAADHAHGFITATIGNAGSHSHPGSLTTWITHNEGQHRHSVSFGANSFGVATGSGGTAVGTGDGFTATDGAHQHALALAVDGDHTHPLTLNMAGSGALALTIADKVATMQNTGGGLRHNNTPLFINVAVYMVL